MLREMTNAIRRPLGKIRGRVEPYVRSKVDDYRSNRRWLGDNARILVLRHPIRNPFAYQVVLDWLATDYAEVRSYFELCTLPKKIKDWSPYRVCVAWMNDPVQEWSPWGYRKAHEITERCRVLGIDVINPVDRLLNAAKFEGPRRMREVGIPVPDSKRISNLEEFKETALETSFPLIVREEWGHGHELKRFDSIEELKSLDECSFERPIAVEFVNVSDPNDGIYRKYRCIVAGDVAVSISMHTQRQWVTRGENCVRTPAIVEEEREFISNVNPHARLFRRAANALELDFVAFDYSYDRCGKLIVWEANPFPVLNLRSKTRRESYLRSVAGMVRLYLVRAELPVPTSLSELIAQYQVEAPGGHRVMDRSSDR